MKRSIQHNFLHDDRFISLRRIEGQIRGITKMIEEGKYCVDIINQISAVTNALYRVSGKTLTRHMETCVVSAMQGKSEIKRKEKINEVLNIIQRMRK